MKPLALVCVGMLLLVGVVVGATQDCQNPGSMSNIAGYGTYVLSPNGGNSYVTNSGGATINAVAIPMSYAAVTNSARLQINLYDSSSALMWTQAGGSAPLARYEMKMVGGQAILYRDGISIGTSGVLGSNPSYVSWSNTGSGSLDDFVFGDSDGHYVFGMPEANAYVIERDFTNPSASGFYTYSGTLINSNNMTTTFSKDNGDNETVFLANTDTGTVYATYYTGTAYTGSIAWDLNALFNANAPMGRYRTYIPGHGFSQSIFYIGSGASINFNSHTYSQGDTATITYAVSTGAYWNPTLYNYQIVIQDIYANVKSTQPLTTQTGSVSYLWKTTDDPNIYYAIIEAVDKTTGKVVWMNFDYTTINSYTTFSGVVHDGQTEAVIPGANVSISQGSISSNTITPSGGSYSATGFYSGVATLINVTEGNYTPYRVYITPMKGGAIPLDFTIYPNPASVTGVGVGGVVRTGVLSGINVTQGYGEPIPFAQVWFVNATTHENYYTISNSVGGYLIDEAHGGTA